MQLLLGIGGWRLLAALGIQPDVCHLNVGHAAFAVLERARSFMEETRQHFDVALAVRRAGNLFTTHTAVHADGANGGHAVGQGMKRIRQLDRASGRHVYSGAVSAARTAGDYTVRVIPHCAGVAVPLETAQILWQR